MTASVKTIMEQIPHLSGEMQDIREILLANAVLFGEIPGPTYSEEDRIRFLQDRLHEAGCQSVSTDEVGNGAGIWPGKNKSRYILVSAHVDTPFPGNVDHTVMVSDDRLEGPGILDNALGLAAVASLPTILERLDLTLDSNLILLGSTRSLGRGDIEGMRFFLRNNKLPIQAGVVVEGGTLGRLSFSSLGMLRAVVRVELPRKLDVDRYGRGGAIPVLNRIVTALRAIPLPGEPDTRIILGSMHSGNAYNTVPWQGKLKFEVRSEQSGMVPHIMQKVETLCEEVEHVTGARVVVEVVASRQSGGLPYEHPMVSTVRSIMRKLDLKPIIAPSTGELAAMIEQGIPAVTLGLTEGEHVHEMNESAYIQPVFTGLTQLIALLLAADQGICHE